MMSRRPHKAQSRFVFAGEYAVDRIASRAGCQPRDFERVRTNDCIGVEVPATARGQRRDIVDVSWFVDPFESRSRDRLPTRARALGQESGRFQPGGNLPKACGPLWVIARVVVQKPRIVIEKCHAIQRLERKSAA